MKWISSVFVVFILSYLNAQSVQTQTKIITENGLTKKWVITNEYDANGQLIRSDSSYTELNADNSKNGNSFFFYHSPDTSFTHGFGAAPEDDFFMIPDSSNQFSPFFRHQPDALQYFEDFQKDLKELMDKYQPYFTPIEKNENIRRDSTLNTNGANIKRI